MDAVTFIYCYPEAIQTPERRAEVMTALASLAAELKLGPDIELRPDDKGQVTVPDVAPEDTWAALNLAVPHWADHELFIPPDSE